MQIDLFTLKIEKCYLYQLGEELTLLGRISSISDKGVFSPKRLDTQAIYVNKTTSSSGSYLILQFFRISTSLRSYIKSNLQKGLSPFVFEQVKTLLFTEQNEPTEETSLLSTQLVQLQAQSVLKPSTYLAVLLSEVILPILASILPKRFAHGLFTLALFLFEAISGLTLTLNRVVIFSFLKFLSMSVHKQSHSLLIFFFSFLILSCAVPFVVFDRSIQMAFLSGLGIRLLLPLWFAQTQRQSLGERIQASRWLIFFKKNGVISYVSSTLAIFIGAQVFVLPLIILDQGQISWRNFLFQATLFFWLPCFFLISLICFVLAFICPWGLWMANLLFSEVFQLFLRFSQFWLSLPSHDTAISLSTWQVLSYWCFLLALFWYLQLRFRSQRHGGV